MASRRTALLGVLSLVVACRGLEPRERGPRLSQTDAGANDGASSCGPITYQGCCEGETLRYCASGKVLAKSCGPAGHCGWSALFGVYVCGSASGSDPGGLPRACPAVDGGASMDNQRPGDGPREAQVASVDAAGCGNVAYTGCCAGTQLYFCSGGALLGLDCAASPLCGWNSDRGYYGCGTSGGTDPSGLHAKACGTLPDSGIGDAHVEQKPDAPKLDGFAEGPAVAEAGGDLNSADRPIGERVTDRARSISGLDPSGLEVRRGEPPGSGADGGCGCLLEGGSAGEGAPWSLLSVLVLCLLRFGRRRR